MAIPTPGDASQRAVYQALQVLAASSDALPLTVDQFLRICRHSPDYARRLLRIYRTPLVGTPRRCAKELGTLVREAEWELNGASTFISEHGILESEFIQHKLKQQPNGFSDDELQLLLAQAPLPPLRSTVLNELASRTRQFADAITDSPVNLSADFESLKKSIRNYGFTEELNEVLQKIDDDLSQQADAFDQTATMKHIRSFFEQLHEKIGIELRAKKPGTIDGTPLDKCGQAIDFLHRKDVIIDKLRELGRCLHSILSDGSFGVHALKASRDYTRLCRNMVVEYAVTLFLELERRLAATD